MQLPKIAELNDDVLDVELGRLERQVVRNALNRYKDELEKSQKKDRELGVPNEATALLLSVIEGDNGWGKGLYSKMWEQTGLDDEEKARAAEEAAEAALVALRDGIYQFDSPPIPLAAIRGWTEEQRELANAYVTAMLDDSDPAAEVDAPSFIGVAIGAEIDAREALTARIAEFAAPQLPLHLVVDWTETEVEEAAAWTAAQGRAWAGEELSAEETTMPAHLEAAIEKARGKVHAAEATDAEAAVAGVAG